VGDENEEEEEEEEEEERRGASRGVFRFAVLVGDASGLGRALWRVLFGLLERKNTQLASWGLNARRSVVVAVTSRRGKCSLF